MKNYVLGIDQSTQGTKALLFDSYGSLLCRTTILHRQIVNDQGWVSHDPDEIWKNTVRAVRDLVDKAGIDKNSIATVGISNQRETSVCWDRQTGKPVCDAIVWQCSRAKEICSRLEKTGMGDTVWEKTGLRISPYFPAAKWTWMLENVSGLKEKMAEDRICMGTIDSWLVYRMTDGKEFRTDYSNASRTELFNIHTLQWDEELLNLFGISRSSLPEVTDSNGIFGETDFDGYLDEKIPIRAAMGDSNGSLFGQGCLEKGMMKATYGTGSSIMMNIGDRPILTENGVVTSLAWSFDGKAQYVFEDNINYTGAVITWLKDDVGLIQSPGETTQLCKDAHPEDTTYLVPAFTGLGAPYWRSDAKGLITGMTRVTGKKEIVRAAVESIAYQISDAVHLMAESVDIPLKELRVDGGATKNDYLMQFQSSLLNLPVRVPNAEELSGIGAAYAAGLASGIFDENVFQTLKRTDYYPEMDDSMRREKLDGWKSAVERTLH